MKIRVWIQRKIVDLGAYPIIALRYQPPSPIDDCFTVKRTAQPADIRFLRLVAPPYRAPWWRRLGAYVASLPAAPRFVKERFAPKTYATDLRKVLASNSIKDGA